MKSKSNPFLRHSLALAAFPALLSIGIARADTYDWTGATDSNFSIGSSWVGGAWNQWSDYRIGAPPTNTLLTIDGYYGIGSLTLQSLLTQDIVINSTSGQPVIMGTDQSSSSASITIASDSSNLTINGVYIASTAVTWDVGSGRTLTMAGQLNNWYNPASLVKNGAGTAVLSGGNNYTGLTTINAGTLLATNNTALGVGGHNGTSMTFIYDGATLALLGGISLDEHFHVYGSGVGGLGALRSLSGNNTLTNTNSGAAGYAIRSNTTVGVDADTLSVAGFYEETGSFSLTKVGAGTLALTAPNTHTGGTTINDGTVEAQRGRLGTSAVVIHSGGTLYATDQWVLCGANQYGEAHSNIGTLTINAGGTLHLDETNGFANGATNLFLNGGSVTGGFNSDQRGALYLWNGNEQITAGGATTSSISVSIGLTGTNNTITVDDGSMLNITEGMKNSDWYGPNTFSGGFIKAGGGTLNLSGANTYSGGTTVDGGTLKVTGQNYLPGNGGITIGTGATLMTDAANDSNTQNVSSTMTLNGGTLAAGTGTSANNGHGPWGNYYLNNGASLQAGGPTTSTIAASLGLNGTGGYTPINVDGGSTLNISGDIFGVSYVAWGAFSKSGDGTLVLSGYNKATSQGMILSAGTVEFSTNSLPTNLRAASGPGGYSADIQGNATLRWASGNTQDISFENGSSQIRIGDGVTATFDTNGNNVTLGTAFDLGVSQTGALTKAGNGTLTLSGTNTYTGATTVSAGTLSLSSACLNDASTVSIASDAVLDLTHGLTDVVSSLVINGTPLDNGTYTASSPATTGYITGTGSIQVVPAVPFLAWINETWPTLSDKTPNGDPDNDGIANLVEYVLQGGDPSVSTTGTLPTVDASGGNFIFTFYRRAAATGTTQTFEYGTNLSGWTPVAIPGSSGVTVADQGGGIDKVEITVAKGAETQLFGRLQVVK